MIYMNVMSDSSEVTVYNCSDMLVYIETMDLSDFPDMRGLCHWHKDIEIAYIIDGEMDYHINGKTVHLEKENCLVINSQQLHYGASHHHHACKFLCIRFHPKILAADPSVYQNYVATLTESNAIDYLIYREDTLNYREIETLVDRLYRIRTAKKDAYELELISALYLLWCTLFRQCQERLSLEPEPGHHDLVLQKKMVSYIQEHYKEPVTLDEIAASANISRSKCCIVFKKYLQQTPIDFLNKYRLELSRRYLADTETNITQIAFSCGFNHLSYYSKIFCREYGCTPTEYRKGIRM